MAPSRSSNLRNSCSIDITSLPVIASFTLGITHRHIQSAENLVFVAKSVFFYPRMGEYKEKRVRAAEYQQTHSNTKRTKPAKIKCWWYHERKRRAMRWKKKSIVNICFVSKEFSLHRSSFHPRFDSHSCVRFSQWTMQKENNDKTVLLNSVK